MVGRKTIILIRHGQYIPSSAKGAEVLTALGRRQAKYATNRLKEFKKIDRIVSSTMPRAAATAAIIKRELRYRRPIHPCDKLRECVPGFPKHLRKKFGFTDTKKLKAHKAQADQAFNKHFTAARKDSVVVLVCHGNIIRYLICRVLGIDTLKWREMDIHQCAISSAEIKSKGSPRMFLISHNDVGHIPKGKRSHL